MEDWMQQMRKLSLIHIFRNLKLHDLRERIGYVPQKAVLFSGTIDSNIRYGKEELST